MRIMHALLPAAMTLATFAAPSAASTVASGFDNLGTVVRCDDCATGAIAPGFSLNYFGTTFNQLFISNNGYLTFNSGQGTFTPGGLGAGYSGQPIIAAFFADVDTRPLSAGSVTYGTGTYSGRQAFGTTWNAVGYYNQQVDKLNTFQILLTDRSDVNSGDFDIYLNYGQIQWETGSASGGTNGFGGTSAAAGFNAGTGNGSGTFFEIAGSRINGAFLDNGPNALIRGSNIGNPGQFRFQVRNGQVVLPGVPEPSTWAMLIAGFGLVGATMRRRATVAA